MGSRNLFYFRPDAIKVTRMFSLKDTLDALCSGVWGGREKEEMMYLFWQVGSKKRSQFNYLIYLIYLFTYHMDTTASSVPRKTEVRFVDFFVYLCVPLII